MKSEWLPFESCDLPPPSRTSHCFRHNPHFYGVRRFIVWWANRNKEKAAVVNKQTAEAPVVVVEDGPWGDPNWAQLSPLLRGNGAPGGTSDGAPGQLVDAAWLVALAADGGTIPRREHLPAAALISPEALQECGTVFEGLPIIAVSCPWLTPTHPDPHGHFLRRVARALDAFLKAREHGHTASRLFGVFWDFMSLHQLPPDDSKTQVEDTIFRYSRKLIAGSTTPTPSIVSTQISFLASNPTEPQPSPSSSSV